MAQLNAPFNAQQFDPTQQGGSFNQLPVGTHKVVAVASEIKATQAGDGGMLVFDLQVIEGPGQGKSGPLRLNLYSSSDKARQIAENQYAALCYATGVLMPTDTQQHHNIPFVVEVENQELTAQQQAKKDAGEAVTPFTQVRKILNADGSVPGMGGAAQQPQQGQQQQQNFNQGGGQQQQPQQNAQNGWNNGGGQGQAQGGQNWGNQGQQQQPPQNNWQQNNQQGNQGGPAWARK